MIRYRKLRDLKAAMRHVVDRDDLIVELFRSMPELQCFGFTKSQEYDDNNYYDHTRLTSINGHLYSNGYEDEEGFPENHEVSNLPKIADHKVHWIEDLVDWIEDVYERDDEELVFKREHYETSKPRRLDREQRYFSAYLTKKKLPDSFFVKSDPKYALYHALDHGRFKPEVEYKIFAKHGEMENALEYARHIIKGRLPEAVENFYFLDCSDEDKECFQEYLAEFGSGERGAA